MVKPPGGPLDGKVALVTGAEAALGRGLAVALAAAGAGVGLLGHVDHGVLADLGSTGVPMVVAPTDFASRDDVVEAFTFASGRLGPADIVVHTAVDPVAFEPRLLADVDDAHFDAVWEATMEATLWCLQAAYGQMAGRGGRILIAVPTLAITGAAGLAPVAAAAEAQRLLAKSAARQWGPDGITVNCLAVAAELMASPAGSEPGPSGPPKPPGPPPPAPTGSLAAAALGRPGRPEEDLGPVAVFLASDAGHFVTGSTLCLDGGVVMAP